ncbi:hypothetical protein PYCCODRAFT_350780 [Trametes coccinea BRFM310]|uniref:Uncharacterized protein n=1 Tax=Trametes coccinea (strain BRFM310) TaxID=1353009 RepID=A0A1Y2J324_TRAC3|nr:hypothetical protein PYCCODRAFT_350780 [Trametes coccinea BRFM310]
MALTSESARCLFSTSTFARRAVDRRNPHRQGHIAPVASYRRVPSSPFPIVCAFGSPDEVRDQDFANVAIALLQSSSRGPPWEKARSRYRRARLRCASCIRVSPSTPASSPATLSTLVRRVPVCRATAERRRGFNAASARLTESDMAWVGSIVCCGCHDMFGAWPDVRRGAFLTRSPEGDPSSGVSSIFLVPFGCQGSYLERRVPSHSGARDLRVCLRCGMVRGSRRRGDLVRQKTRA